MLSGFPVNKQVVGASKLCIVATSVLHLADVTVGGDDE